MATQKQREAAKRNIQKAQAAWEMPTRAQQRAR